jgi:hypothetical protein
MAALFNRLAYAGLALAGAGVLVNKTLYNGELMLAYLDHNPIPVALTSLSVVVVIQSNLDTAPLSSTCFAKEFCQTCTARARIS